jgi:hypothetical protein
VKYKIRNYPVLPRESEHERLYRTAGCGSQAVISYFVLVKYLRGKKAYGTARWPPMARAPLVWDAPIENTKMDVYD